MSKSKKQKKQEKLTDAVGTIMDGQSFEMVCNVFAPIMSNMIESVPPVIGMPLILGFMKQVLTEAYGDCIHEVHDYDGPLQ
jgi:hypothetical protein